MTKKRFRDSAHSLIMREAAACSRMKPKWTVNPPDREPCLATDEPPVTATPPQEGTTDDR